MTWTELESVVLSEISQSETNKYHTNKGGEKERGNSRTRVLATEKKLLVQRGEEGEVG